MDSLNNNPDGGQIDQEVQAPNKFPFSISKKIFIIGGVFLIIIIPAALFLVLSKSSKPNPIDHKVNLQITPMPATTEDGVIITVNRNEDVIVPGSSISVNLIESGTPEEGCFDCISSDALEISKDGIKVNLSYPCGGIAGKCVTKQAAHGYSFETLDRPTEDSIRLKVQRIDGS